MKNGSMRRVDGIPTLNVGGRRTAAKPKFLIYCETIGFLVEITVIWS